MRLLSLKEERGQRHLILGERFLPLHIPSHLKGRLNLLQIGVPSGEIETLGSEVGVLEVDLEFLGFRGIIAFEKLKSLNKVG
ncbi:Werner syndrome-like protein [Caldicellulosiruptor owensensis OL]|uniref:Werner syndrome-like protein n=1 Tax=Caldicellulosiruptor owensensis (strain ATCC 700167 / DSM 13100 / OL) TaxID=632518 RepID=E4Q320_CALOW|nr:Werner syndrome-like protein [Caldicellulosiruptor owensensis OL]